MFDHGRPQADSLSPGEVPQRGLPESVAPGLINPFDGTYPSPSNPTRWRVHSFGATGFLQEGALFVPLRAHLLWLSVTTTLSSDKKLFFIAKNPAGKVVINTSQAPLGLASKPPEGVGDGTSLVQC